MGELSEQLLRDIDAEQNRRREEKLLDANTPWKEQDAIISRFTQTPEFQHIPEKDRVGFISYLKEVGSLYLLNESPGTAVRSYYDDYVNGPILKAASDKVVSNAREKRKMAEDEAIAKRALEQAERQAIINRTQKTIAERISRGLQNSEAVYTGDTIYPSEDSSDVLESTKAEASGVLPDFSSIMEDNDPESENT